MSDELFQVPLEQFTATRDALAARLRASGRKDADDDTRGIRKPSIAAWAANQVVWHAPDDWHRLQATAAAMRKAVQTGSSPDELRQAAREQREALTACEARAAELLREDGHPATPNVVEKVSHSLLALAYGATDAVPGRLERELPAPGFEVLAGLTLVAPRPQAAAAPPPERTAARPSPPARRAAPAVREAARPSAAEKRGAEQARRAEEEARARQRAALKAEESRLAESRRAVLKARARLDSEEKRRAELEAQLAEAQRACDDAKRQVEAADAEQARAEAAVAELR